MTFEWFGEPQFHSDGELLQLAFAADGALWTVEDPGILRSWDAQTGRQREWHALSDLETLWAFSHDARVLGHVAHNSVVSAFGAKKSAAPFKHGGKNMLGEVALFLGV